jgi:undecaprenyl-diphosphatase
MPESLQEKRGAEIYSEPLAKATQKAQADLQNQTAPKPVRRFRTIVFQGFLIFLISAFAILAFFANTTPYFPVDLIITHFFQSDKATWFSTFMNFISWFGFTPQAPAIAVLVVIFIFVLGLRWEAIATLLTIIVNGLANFLIKLVVHRPRPSASLVEVFRHVSGFSFPSGHVMFYMTLFGFLLFLTFTLLKPSVIRTLLMILFSAMIVLVGPSRIFLGEHWASDVLGGYLLGSLVLIAAVQFYQWGKPRFFIRQPVAPDETPEP